MAEEEQGDKLHRGYAKKSVDLLAAMLHMETKAQREAREARREAARKQDRGFANPMRYLVGAEKDKKGGLFGMLKSIGKLIGGTFMKVIGPMWKILKVLFKVLKFTAGGLALLAAGLFFSMSPGKQEETIESVIAFFKKIGEVLSNLGKAFGAAFMKNMDDMTDEEGNPIEGLVSKFGKFKEAWAGVLEKLKGVKLTVGGKTYKGLEGMATMLGDMFGKIAGFFLDLGTAIAEFIMDPRKMIVKMSVAVSNFFGGMVDTIGRFIDEFTSMEFLMGLLPPWMRKLDMVQDWTREASETRAKEKKAEMDALRSKDAILKERASSAEEEYNISNAKMEALDAQLNDEKIKLSDEQRKKLETERDRHNEERLIALDLSLEAKAELERNKDRFEYAKDAYNKSTEIALKEQANLIMREKGLGDFVALEQRLLDQQEEKGKLLSDSISDAWQVGEIDLSLTKARQVKNLLGDKDAKQLTQADLDQKGMALKLAKLGVKSDDVDDLSKVKDLLKRLAERETSIVDKTAEIAKSQAQQAKLQPAIDAAMDQARKDAGLDVKDMHEGGLIGEGGLANVAAGEVMFDNKSAELLAHTVSTASGMNLMQLQRDSLAASGAGAPIIIQNNNSSQVNQSQPIVIPNSPILPGNEEAPRLLS